MAALINRLISLESNIGAGVKYYCPVANDVMSQPVGSAPWMSSYAHDSSHEPLNMDGADIIKAVSAMGFSSLREVIDLMQQMCAPSSDAIKLSM